MNLPELLHTELDRRNRPNDGLLHASEHFLGSLRHTQLAVVGAPQRDDESFARQMPLLIGQAMHDFVHASLRGQPYMAEVNVTPWMPKGWGGTADALVFRPTKKFQLEDYKSSQGRSMWYVVQDGAKDEHRAQVSLYWHAAVDMGLPMEPCINVWYLPKDASGKYVEPLKVSFKPTPKRALHAEAAYRYRRVEEYRESLGDFNDPDFLEGWVTSALDPVQDRVQKLFYDRQTETWDLKLVPHWSAAYCPYPPELCDCHEQGDTKIGMFDVDGVTYIPRKGYENIEPTVFPT